MSVIGKPIDRTDGRAKVTGAARYAAEFPVQRLAYASLVTSTVPHGRIAGIDTREAAAMPGVLLAMTHENAPRLPDDGQAGAGQPPAGRVLNLLQDDRVHYNNQPIAVVVADTLEHAQDAAGRVRVRYRSEDAVLDFSRAKRGARKPDKKVQDEPADTHRGNLAAGMNAAAATIDATYTTPFEHHNPMEPHATIAVWEGDHLTLYDSTQYVSGVKQTVAKRFGMPQDKVRVLCPFTGGGFGCKGSTWSHVVLAAMAAKQAGRPVKLVLERPQMFGPVGCRPNTEQNLLVAADRDG
ncbi:MAG: xanthine dehydrogenase family protein molybdopterin-binding subunit, partial [Burkholderiaceae bacterium]